MRKWFNLILFASGCLFTLACAPVFAQEKYPLLIKVSLTNAPAAFALQKVFEEKISSYQKCDFEDPDWHRKLTLKYAEKGGFLAISGTIVGRVNFEEDIDEADKAWQALKEEFPDNLGGKSLAQMDSVMTGISSTKEFNLWRVQWEFEVCQELEVGSRIHDVANRLAERLYHNCIKGEFTAWRRELLSKELGNLADDAVTLAKQVSETSRAMTKAQTEAEKLILTHHLAGLQAKFETVSSRVNDVKAKLKAFPPEVLQLPAIPNP